MNLETLATPALVLDRARLARNTAAMTRRAKELGVRLRPHLKTAKSAKVARLAVAGNFGGITVATLREAEYFLENAIADITYAVPIVPSKLDRAAAMSSPPGAAATAGRDARRFQASAFSSSPDWSCSPATH